MKILVTGATGFIGRRLSTLLVADGHAVTAVGRHICEVLGVEHLQVPELNPVCINRSLGARSFDAVVHLAAAGVDPQQRNLATLTAINVELPIFLASLAAERGAQALLLAGSSAEYMPAIDARPLTEDSPLETERPYGASKAAGGMNAMAFGAARGLPVVVLRLFNVFGPGEAPHRLLPSLIHGLSYSRPVQLSAGSQVRDFVYVDDACAAFIDALHALSQKTLVAGAYNVCTGIGSTVGEFSRH